MAEVLYTDSARSDLLQAWLIIAEDSPVAADRLLDAIEREAATLALHPLMGRARPELANDARSWPTSTPFILFYLPAAPGITVLRVLHHAPDIERVAFCPPSFRNRIAPARNGRLPNRTLAQITRPVRSQRRETPTEAAGSPSKVRSGQGHVSM